jgi:hypothetical protein
MFRETGFHHRLHLGEAEIFAREQVGRLRDIPPLNTLRVLVKRFDLFAKRPFCLLRCNLVANGSKGRNCDRLFEVPEVSAGSQIGEIDPKRRTSLL